MASTPTTSHFDEHQFAGRQNQAQPVETHATADGFVSTGIDFADYAHMHTYRRKPSGERRLPTPRWAVHDGMLQELLVSLLEERVATNNKRLLRKLSEGELPERLERAHKILMRRRNAHSDVLTSLCKRYGAEEDPRRKRMLRIEIENLDTFLRYTTTRSGAGVIAAIVVLYYRVGMDSPAVGAELGLKPPHVRAMLWRLFQTAKALAATNPMFAEELNDGRSNHFARPRRNTIRNVPVGHVAVLEYRNAVVTLLEDAGTRLKIRNGNGESLWVETKAVIVEYAKAATA